MRHLSKIFIAIVFLGMGGCNASSGSSAPSQLENENTSNACKPLDKPQSKAITRPFFYSIKKNGQTSYLLGTFHIGISLEDFPADIQTHLKNAKSVVVERTKTFAEVQAFLDNPISSFRNSVPRESIKISPQESAKAACYGVPLEITSEIPDSNCGIVLYAPYFFPHPQSLDMYILKTAYTLHKKLVQLDSNELLIEVKNRFSKVGTESQCSVSRDIFVYSNKEIRNMSEKQLDQYRDGNEDVYEKNSDPAIEFRNRAWIANLDKSLSSGNVFVATGTTHLFGPSGIIRLLQDRGYEILRMETFP